MWQKRIKLIVMTITLAFFLVSCEDVPRVTKVELGRFPDRIVYFAGEDTEIEYGDATVLIYSKNDVDEEPITTHYCEITNNIDFTIPGLYEIKVTWMGELVCRIPIQVINKADWLI